MARRRHAGRALRARADRRARFARRRRARPLPAQSAAGEPLRGPRPNRPPCESAHAGRVRPRGAGADACPDVRYDRHERRRAIAGATARREREGCDASRAHARSCGLRQPHAGPELQLPLREVPAYTSIATVAATSPRAGLEQDTTGRVARQARGSYPLAVVLLGLLRDRPNYLA